MNTISSHIPHKSRVSNERGSPLQKVQPVGAFVALQRHKKRSPFLNTVLVGVIQDLVKKLRGNFNTCLQSNAPDEEQKRCDQGIREAHRDRLLDYSDPEHSKSSRYFNHWVQNHMLSSIRQECQDKMDAEKTDIQALHELIGDGEFNSGLTPDFQTLSNWVIKANNEMMKD